MKLPWILMPEARIEAYRHFDQAIRALPKSPNGAFDEDLGGFMDNDVDAFRHAYVSGVFTLEYTETAADIFGRLYEANPADYYSNAHDPRARNMDLWNNAIGRKYGARCGTREQLLESLRSALRNGELITSLEDPSKYEGASNDPRNASKPVIVLRESEQGRNELFYDMLKEEVLTLEEFVGAIRAGRYPGYSVKMLAGIPTPVSKPDRRKTNNLA